MERVMKRLGFTFGIAALCLVLSGCAEEGFGNETVAQILQTGKIRIEGEQVILTQAQLDCGTREELWTPESTGARSIARLSAQASALGFADNLQIGDRSVPASVQVRGEFPLQVLKVLTIKDKDASTKIAEAKVGIKVKHSCLAGALPLMGIKRGDFSADAAPRFQIGGGPQWAFERILH